MSDKLSKLSPPINYLFNICEGIQRWQPTLMYVIALNKATIY